jgi:TfoX/Sxy family transcriptional regulator of competence genes
MLQTNKHEDRIFALLAKTYPTLTKKRKVEFENVFGAVGLFVDGRIFASSGKFGIALRLPEEVLTDLFQNKRAKRLKYFAKGHIKKEHAVIPLSILRRQREIRSLVHKSGRYTVSLPK